MTDLRLAGAWIATPNAGPARVVDPRACTGPPDWRVRPHEGPETAYVPQLTSCLPVSAAAIMAAAHPTPLSTMIASVGQFS